MNCSDFLKELTDYLDGALDENTKSDLDEHLAWCHDCFVICNTTQKTIEIYRESELYVLPEDLRDRLRAAIMQRCNATRASKCASPEPQERV